MDATDERSAALGRPANVLSGMLMVIVLTAPAILFIAFRAGRRAGRRKTACWRPIFQLVEHRRRCLGHDRARLERELGTVLRLPPWAWTALLTPPRPLDRARRRSQSAP